ncbi:hypothetical protein QVA66_09450 [Staphylococcus chromogenes]|nr:hypothetical protein [Staphylococcus chromogenes]
MKKILKSSWAAVVSVLLLAAPLAACDNPLGGKETPTTRVVTVTQGADAETSTSNASSAPPSSSKEPSKKQAVPVSHEVPEDIKNKMLTQHWPGLCGTESGPMVDGEFKSASGRGGFGSIKTKIGSGEAKVNMLQFDFDKDGEQEMYLAASCVPGAVGWPPLLVKVNPDLTIDAGNGMPKKGISLPAGVNAGRGNFTEFRAEGDTLHLSFRVAGPNDPACCPSLSETGNYVVRNGALVRADNTAPQAAGKDEPSAEQRCKAPHYVPKNGSVVSYCDGTWLSAGKPQTDMVGYWYWKDGAWQTPEAQGTNRYGMTMPCYTAEYLKTLPPRPAQIKLYECRPQDVGKF